MVGHSGTGSGSQGLWRTKMISSVAEIKEDRDKVARETKVLQNYVLLTHLNVVLVWELTHTHTHTNR